MMTDRKGRPGPTIPPFMTLEFKADLLEVRRSGLPEIARRAAWLLLLADGYPASEAAAACGLTEA